METNKKIWILELASILVIVLVIGGFYFLMPKKNNISSTKFSGNQNQENKKNIPASTPKKDYKSISSSLEDKVVSGTATADDLINLGIAEYNLGQYDDAIKYYDQAIVQDPSKSAMIYNAEGNVLRDQKKYQEAEDSYRKSIQGDPSLVNAYVNLANLLDVYENNNNAAITVLQEGVSNNPDDQSLNKLLTEYIK